MVIPGRILIADLVDSKAYRHVGEVGLRVGGYTTLGAVGGLVAAAIAKTWRPQKQISYGDWTAYGAAVLGLFATSVEVFSSIGVG
jgi:hypothetical protein